MPTIPTFDYELKYWRQGIKNIAGIDEVGMGALAGPVCAAVVIFPPDIHTSKTPLAPLARGVNDELPIIRDSKQLSSSQREKAAQWIKNNALAWAIGEASVEEIERFNILVAAHLAMRRAVASLNTQPELLLIDGRPAHLSALAPELNIIKGDQLCFSIAAASIIAKVHRDRIMDSLAKQYPAYHWQSNKGYGSRTHKEAIRNAGITVFHRKSYAPIASLISPILKR